MSFFQSVNSSKPNPFVAYEKGLTRGHQDWGLLIQVGVMAVCVMVWRFIPIGYFPALFLFLFPRGSFLFHTKMEETETLAKTGHCVRIPEARILPISYAFN